MHSATMRGSEPICLPTSSNPGQSGGKTAGLPMQNHSDYCMVAQHTLVLEYSGHVEPDSFVPAQPAHTAIPSDPSQESVNLNLHAWLPEPQL